MPTSTLDITGGDFKSSAHDPYAIFRVGDSSANVAVEVCLDHSDRRIRRNIDRNPWPARGEGIDLHLIPSCGMQLHPPAVAARAGGWAFNCDGQYALTPESPSGTSSSGVIGGVTGIHTDYVSASDAGYAAHSQLARVRTAAKLGNEKAPGASDTVFDDAPSVDVVVIPVAATPDLDGHFAGGSGAVHIYGATKPLPIRG